MSKCMAVDGTDTHSEDMYAVETFAGTGLTVLCGDHLRRLFDGLVSHPALADE